MLRFAEGCLVMTCKKCGKQVSKLFPKGRCESCYIEITQAMAEIVEKEKYRARKASR